MGQSKFFKLIIVLLILIGIIMLSFYFYTFNQTFSNDSNDWGNFGSYLSPITNLLTMSILFLTLYIQKKESIENIKKLESQHRENIEQIDSQHHENIEKIDSQHRENISALEIQIKHSESRIELYKIEKEIEIYSKFLTGMNKYLINITRICTNILRINRLYQLSQGIAAGRESTEYITNDYFEQVKIVKKLMDEIKTAHDRGKDTFKDNRHYDLFIKSCNELLDFDLFIITTERMQEETIDSIFFLNQKYIDKYSGLVALIEKLTKKNMKNFSVFEFKNIIEEFNKEVINYISKLREKLKTTN